MKWQWQRECEYCILCHIMNACDEPLNMLWTLLLQKGRCKTSLRHRACLASSEQRNCIAVCHGSSAKYIKVYVNVLTEKIRSAKG